MPIVLYFIGLLEIYFKNFTNIVKIDLFNLSKLF